MTRKLSIKVLALCSVCLVPFQALAQEKSDFDVDDKPPAIETKPVSTNSVSIGTMYQSGRSAYLGRFTGMNHPGFYGSGDFHYFEKDAWDSGSARFFEMNGRDLGNWDRSADVKFGDQGHWSLNAGYDGIPYYATDGLRTIYQPNGSLIASVAPGSVTWGFSQILKANGALPPIWQPVFGAGQAPAFINAAINFQRDIFTVGGKFYWGAWTLSSAIKHDHKEGTQVGSLEFGGTGVTTSSSATIPTTRTTGVVYFPQAVNYDMDTFNFTAAYKRGGFQSQLMYVFSQFTENTNNFTVQNPFLFTPLTSFNNLPPAQLTAVYPSPPSNSAHQFKALLAYSFDPKTRLNANFGYSVQLQNDQFALGTGNANLPQIVPRTSFNGEMDTYFANVSLTAQPFEKSDLRLAVSVDDRENKSPLTLFSSIYPRSTNANEGPLYNLPFSYDKQSADVEFGYKLTTHTKLTAYDTYSAEFRDYTDTSRTTTNRAGVKLRSTVLDDVFASIGYLHEDRRARLYDSNGWWRSMGCGTPVGTADCGAEPAGFYMFFEAPRVRDEVKGLFDLSPQGPLTGSLMVKYAKDRYTDSTYGLRDNSNFTVGPDIAWKPRADFSAHAYYTYQRINRDNASLYSSGNAATTGYFVPYTEKTKDSTQTLGVSADWAAIPDKLHLTLDYNLSYGDTAYVLGDGGALIGNAIASQITIAALNFQPLPNVKTTLNTVRLKGDYTLSSNMVLMLGYAYERFTYQDPMQSNATTQYADLMLPGTYTPNAAIHVVSTGIRFKF